MNHFLFTLDSKPQQTVLPSTNSNNNKSDITETNVHTNQLYYHVHDIQKQQQQPDLTKNIYVPYQKADRVVSVANNNLVDSKNLQKLQLQLQQQQLKQPKTTKQPNESSLSSPVQSSPTATTGAVQQVTTAVFNQSLSSENDSQELRQPTRVSAKIQQLLNTLKV